MTPWKESIPIKRRMPFGPVGSACARLAPAETLVLSGPGTGMVPIGRPDRPGAQGSLPVNGDGNLALFCDFENIALGARDAKYASFDIQLVLQKLLLKGSIVVKKAYCDWDRYKQFKDAMHEAAFELIEIPHVRQSGKNSADIRMVVDALDLCYTKAHIDTFVIISGDSDFSPLVSKLRENAKTVIGIGVKNSTSDLLMSNCDEFIFYDDLVVKRSPSRRRARREPGTKVQKDSKAEDKAS